MANITKELVVASLIPEVAQYKIQQLIEAGQNLKVSTETIKVDFDSLLKIKMVVEALTRRMDERLEPLKEDIAAIKEGFNFYLKPLQEILDNSEPDLVRINAEILAKEKVIKDDIEVKNSKSTELVSFVNDIAKAIAVSPDNKDLTRIQKLIGSQKSRSSSYGGLKDMVEMVCDSLLSMITSRKELIKITQKLWADYEVWYAAGDIDKAVQLKEEIEHNERVVSQNIEQIADAAYKEISSLLPTNIEFESAAIYSRLHRWAYRIDDIETLYKKMPELVVKSPNVKAVNAFMKEKQDELSKDSEHNFNGLVLYYKSFYL